MLKGPVNALSQVPGLPQVAWLYFWASTRSSGTHPIGGLVLPQ